MSEHRFWCVVIDETDMWVRQDTLLMKADRIFCRYVIDTEEVTYICSATKNYYLMEVNSDYQCDKEMTSEEGEAIYDMIISHSDSEATYMHCSRIDPLLKPDTQWGCTPAKGDRAYAFPVEGAEDLDDAHNQVLCNT